MIIETTPLYSEKESLYVLMYNDHFVNVHQNSDLSMSVSLDYAFDSGEAEMSLEDAQLLFDMIVSKKYYRTNEDIEVHLDVSEDIIEYTDIKESFEKRLRIVNVHIDTYATIIELD